MDKSNQSDYEEFLTSTHSKLITPDDVIEDVIKEGAAQDILSKKRIIAGEVSEVYDITLEDNTHVILRISREGHPTFLQEHWAIEQVKAVGVPVPEILHITYKKIADQELAFCIMKKVDGNPLERGSIDFGSLPMDEQRRYIVQAGEILSKIHSVKTEGYGQIYGEGESEYKSSDQVIADTLGRRERMYSIADAENIDRKQIDKAMDIIQSFKENYKKASTVLNHGDYGHKHFMVKDGQIVAILDWGLVRSDTPVFDFAAWDYWYGHYIPTEWLKEGYQNKVLFDDKFETILHTLRIIKGIEVIDWYHPQNYKAGIETAFEKLIVDVNYFR